MAFRKVASFICFFSVVLSIALSLPTAESFPSESKENPSKEYPKETVSDKVPNSDKESGYEAVVAKGESVKYFRDEFKYVAAVVYDDSFICGGTVVGQKWVVTSARCVKGLDVSKMSILAEAISPNDDDAESRDVVEVKLRGNCINSNEECDIALLRLEENLNYACTLEIKDASNVEAPLTLYGFGVTGTGEIPDILLAGNFTLVPQKECVNHLNETLPEKYFCGKGQNDAASCDGDGGGPITKKVSGDHCNDILVGIISYVNSTEHGKCGSRPTVFYNITQLQSWITSEMQ